jgi:hypothetical protein
MHKGLERFAQDNLNAVESLLDGGYEIKTVNLMDETYTDSYILLKHPETKVVIKVLLDNCFFEEFAKEYLINLFQLSKVDNTSDYYSLKESLGDD